MNKKITYKYLILNYIEMLCCGIISGLVSLVVTNSYINQNIENILKNKYFDYIINVIFFNDGYKDIAYMNGSITKLLTILLYFYIPPLMFLLYKYSRETETYYPMIMVRLNSNKEVIKNIRKRPFFLFSVYVVGFMVCVVLIGNNMCEISMNSSILHDILMFSILRIVVLTVFGNILFLIYIKYGTGISVFMVNILFLIMSMTDINIEKVNILLYHPGRCYIENIITLCIILLFIKIMQNKSIL